MARRAPGHHASVPLALAILYQDFPFALADIFLKRALTLLVLVTAALVSVTFLHASSAGAPLGSAREVGSLVLLWVGTALLYPRLRDAIAWFVDTIVLNRPDYDQLRAAIGWAALHIRQRDADGVTNASAQRPIVSAPGAAKLLDGEVRVAGIE